MLRRGERAAIRLDVAHDGDHHGEVDSSASGQSVPVARREARAKNGALNGVDVIGWVSSLILVLTLGKQVSKQWHTRDSRGVSTWLFVGQLAASIGFSTYSFLLENWVFLTTNLLLVVNAVLGQWVTLRNRRQTPPDHPGALPEV